MALYIFVFESRIKLAIFIENMFFKALAVAREKNKANRPKAIGQATLSGWLARLPSLGAGTTSVSGHGPPYKECGHALLGPEPDFS